MSGFLLDTSVLSVFAPDRPPPAPSFRDWLETVGRAQPWHLPVMAVAEVQKGVAKLRRAGGDLRAHRLEMWLEGLLGEFGSRVLPVSADVARRAGVIEDLVLAQGRHPGLPDILIAATADVFELTVLTVNTRHFSVLGVPFVNPFEAPKASN